MTEKRTQILDTATCLFGKHGFHAVGVDWIIARSGVSKMTMYRYFPSKADLVLEVLRREKMVRHEAIDAYVQAANTSLEKLASVFDWYQVWFNDPEFSGCLFTHAASEFADKGTQIHKIVVAQKADLTETLETLARQIPSIAEPTLFAATLAMLLDGATLKAQIAGDQDAASQAWKMANALIDTQILRAA